MRTTTSRSRPVFEAHSICEGPVGDGGQGMREEG